MCECVAEAAERGGNFAIDLRVFFVYFFEYFIVAEFFGVFECFLRVFSTLGADGEVAVSVWFVEDDCSGSVVEHSAYEECSAATRPDEEEYVCLVEDLSDFVSSESESVDGTSQSPCSAESYSE